jgi:hypothetical protein
VTFGAIAPGVLSTRDMSTQLRIARKLVALLVFCLALMIAPMSAYAAPNTAAKPPAKVSVSAELLDAKVKVNGKARIKGRLDVDARAQSGLELVVVQYLSAGVWVDLAPARCYPNSAFRVSVSFSVAAEYTLRVYHPPTTLYAAAYSNTFLLAVIR